MVYTLKTLLKEYKLRLWIDNKWKQYETRRNKGVQNDTDVLVLYNILIYNLKKTIHQFLICHITLGVGSSWVRGSEKNGQKTVARQNTREKLKQRQAENNKVRLICHVTWLQWRHGELANLRRQSKHCEFCGQTHVGSGHQERLPPYPLFSSPSVSNTIRTCVRACPIHR